MQFITNNKRTKNINKHVSSSGNQHTVRWSLVCRCGATNMEQSANPLARLRTITLTIQAVTQDTSLQAYIWLLTAAAPSDKCFSCAGHKLTYLLTYYQRQLSYANCWNMSLMKYAFTDAQYVFAFLMLYILKPFFSIFPLSRYGRASIWSYIKQTI